MVLLDTLIIWSRRFYLAYSRFFSFVSEPLLPQNTFTEILEDINIFNPLYRLMMFIFGVSDIFELTIIHLLTYGILVVCGFTFVKWILDIVL